MGVLCTMNKIVGAEVIIAPGHSRRLIQSYKKCSVFITATNNTSLGTWIMIYDFILSHR